jgi:hypothetical protein
MDVNEFIEKIEEKKKAVRAQRAEDLERLNDRRGAMNQRFTVTIFAMNEVSSTRGDTKFIRQLISSDEYELPLETVKKIAVDIFEGQVEMYTVRYHLEDTADLIEELIGVIEAADDETKIQDLMVHLQEYFAFLEYQIGVRIPFHDLAVAFEGRSTVDEVYYRDDG